MLLIWLTLIVASAIVIALAGYLVLIAVALTQARRDVARIADALERAAEGTAALDDRIGALQAAMRQLAERTAGLGGRLAALLTNTRR